MADTRSISMPPNFSGMITRGQTQLRGFAQNRDGQARLLMLDGLHDSAPLLSSKKSSVVRAIARCSSVKSSGVKTSSGVVVARRKEPPWCFVGERVDVAISNSVSRFSFLVSSIVQKYRRRLGRRRRTSSPCRILNCAASSHAELSPSASRRCSPADGPARSRRRSDSRAPNQALPGESPPALARRKLRSIPRRRCRPSSTRPASALSESPPPVRCP